MFTPFVSDEKPVAIYTGAPPQYTSDGLAIDCALVLHVLQGTARIRCNLEVIQEQPGSVVLFHPGDVIKVEERSADFEVEILAFSSFIQLAALNQLEGVNVKALRKNFILNTPEVSAAANALVTMLRQSLNVCTPREIYFIAVMQLRSFYSLYQIMLRREEKNTEGFRTRPDELFFRFRQLLGEHCRTSRSVGFYADKLAITTRYLTGIVQSRYGKSPKEAIDTYTVMQIRLDLLQTDISLTDLAYKYNFSSPSAFSDYFRRCTGTSPLEYRKMNIE